MAAKSSTKTSKSKSTTGKKATKKTTSTKAASPKPTLPVDLKNAKPPKFNNKILIIVLAILALALIIYRLGPWLVPATVNNKPITRFELYKRLETAYGAQTLDDLINEKILDEAISKSGVTISQDRVDEEMVSIEEQFTDLGGLDEALAQRGMTRAELEKQIVTQLSVEEILKDKIEPTEEEIQEEFDNNAETLYVDQTLEEVKDSIASSLRQSNLSDAFLEWFAQVKQEANVKNLSNSL